MRLRRGEAEVVGGLIVLTLIFLIAVPLILNLVQNAAEATRYASVKKLEAISVLNEKVTILGVPEGSSLFPAVWVNNTGTIAVYLDKVYLFDRHSNKLIAMLDLRTMRPGATGNSIVVDLIPVNYNSYMPPKGEPLPLPPGSALLLKFNGTHPVIQGNEENIIVRVESVPGVIHPVEGGGLPPTLKPSLPTIPGNTSQGGGSGIGAGSGGGLPDLWNFTDPDLLELEFKAEFESATNLTPSIIQAYMIRSPFINLASATVTPDPEYPGFKRVVISKKNLQVFKTEGGYCNISQPLSSSATLELRGLMALKDGGSPVEQVRYLVADIIFRDSSGGIVARLSDICPASSPQGVIPGFIAHSDLTDPVDIGDPDGDGYAEIILETDGVSHFTGMTDGGIVSILYITTDNITVPFPSSAGFILKFDIEIHNNNAFYPSRERNPAIVLILFKVEPGGLEPVAYKVLTYRDIGMMVGDPEHWDEAEGVSFIDVFQGLSPGQVYKMGILMVDAVPHDYVTVVFNRISLYQLP